VLSTNYGDLVPEDELLTHQIVDTFATVSQSDPSWTEKIWTIAHARDNSLQLVLGVGKYTNRGVFDGAAACAAAPSSGPCGRAAGCRAIRRPRTWARCTTGWWSR
jgi:hypothetical protein